MAWIPRLKFAMANFRHPLRKGDAVSRQRKDSIDTAICDRSIADTLFLMTIGVLFAWSLASSILSNTIFPQEPVTFLIRMLLIMAVLRVVFHNKFTLLATLVAGIAACLMLIFDLRFAEETSARSAAVVELAAGTMGFLAGTEVYTAAYEQVIVWTICIVIALFVMFSSYIRFYFFMLLAVSLVVVGISLTYGFNITAPVFYAYVLCIITYLVRYLNTKRDGAELPNSYLALCILPMVAACILLAFVMPTPSEGFIRRAQAALVTRPFNQAANTIHGALRPRYFSLAQTGFGSGDSRLGGNVALNHEAVMRIRTNRLTNAPIYLTGNVLDMYTGYAWVNSLGRDAFPLKEGKNIELYERATSLLTMITVDDDINIETVGTVIGHINRYFGSNAVPRNLRSLYTMLVVVDTHNVLLAEHGILQSNELNVNLGNWRTFTVFHTGIPARAEGVNMQLEFKRNPSGNVTTSELMLRNTYYRLVYYELSPHFEFQNFPEFSYRGVLRDALEEMERLTEQGDEAGLVRVVRGHSEILYADLLRYYLIPHADWINEIYTVLPEYFPERVRELAHRITYNAESDYMRARLLEIHLRYFMGLEYTLTPGITPPDRDFVDYFLFDLRAGYCTSFATAFVTMARAIGLPARYVEGFKVPDGVPDVWGYISVTNAHAHAWGEVYFEGYGWARFEPTPSSDDYQAVNLGNILGDGWGDWQNELWIDDMMWGWGGDGLTANGQTGGGLGGAGGGAADGAPDNAGAVNVILMAVMAAFIAFIMVVCTRIAWVYCRNRRVSRADNNSAVEVHFAAIKKYLRFFKFDMEQGETAVQFAEKVDTNAGLWADKLYLKEAALIFSKACYSGQEVSQQELETIERIQYELDAKMRKTTGKARYIYYKYIMAVV